MESPLLNNSLNQVDDDTGNNSQQNTNIRGSMMKMTATIPTKSNIEDACSEIPSWRKRILDIVFSKSMDIFLACLIVLDVIMAFTELFIMAEYPSCDIIEKYAISCCPSESSNFLGSSKLGRALGLTSDNLCEKGIEYRDYDATCDEDDYPKGVEIANTIIFALGMVILTIFIVEQLLILIALGARKFFGNMFLVLDFVIIMMSILELIVFSLEGHLKQSLSAFMMIFRMWRFVRIGGGIAKSNETFEANFGRANELEKQNDEL